MKIQTNRWARGALLLGAALLVGGPLTACQGQLSESPPIHPNPNMDFQKRYDPQEPSKFFRDHRAMRQPVKGTVARQAKVINGRVKRVSGKDSRYLKADQHLYTGMVNGEFVKTLPKQIQLDQALLERGRNRYNIFCVPCHGANGDGKGVVTLYSGAINPRNFHETRAMAVGQIYRAMAYGAGTMKPYHSQLTVRERWAVVAYIRALQLSRIPSQSR